jgi:hypothetical protein
MADFEAQIAPIVEQLEAIEPTKVAVASDEG